MIHPIIEQIETAGYPKELQVDHEFSGADLLGNEILPGDEILEFDGETIVTEVLNVEAIDAFKKLGATISIYK